jgi:hypothetical protein
MNYNNQLNDITKEFTKMNCLQNNKPFTFFIKIKNNSNSTKIVDKIYRKKFTLFDCRNLYMEKLLKKQKVTFEEYIEYWWDTEETQEQLTNRVCLSLFNKYTSS